MIISFKAAKVVGYFRDLAGYAHDLCAMQEHHVQN
jgi:hypothetical protein